MQVKLIKISYIGTLFKVRFVQDLSIFRVRFRQVSQYYFDSYYYTHTKLSPDIPYNNVAYP